MDVLAEDVRKDVPGSIMFVNDIVLCGDDETGMTEYLGTYRSALEDREMTISRSKPQFIDFNLGQDNGQVSSNACYCSCIYLIIKSFKRFIYPVSISVVAPPRFEPV